MKRRCKCRCRECGREFETDASHRKARYCSDKCRNRRNNRIARLNDTSDYLIRDYDEAIRNAATQPRWCSDARWRIELSRRGNPAHFDAIPDTPVSLFQ